jgi:chromo domain-containing protein 1
LLWRLCVRPELMEYLSEECETHAMELLANDSDAQRYVKCTPSHFTDKTNLHLATHNSTPFSTKLSILS